MDEMNNNQGNPGQDPNQMSGQQQGMNFDPYTGQPYNQNQGPVNPETGNTYWENQNAAQDPNQGYAGQQNAPGQETPAQFYQSYQQQMGGNPYQTPKQQEPKKPKKKLVATLVTLVLVLALAGTAFAFKDKILNALSLGAKSPAEYYASVEQKALNASIDKMLKSHESFDPSKPMAYKVSAELTYDKATLSSLLTGYLGMSIVDLEDMIGISLDSIGADMTVALDDNKLYDQILLKLNKVDIITLELLLDTVQQELLMRLPELSPAYVRQSIDPEYVMDSFSFDTDVDLDLLKDIKAEDVADFTKRYVKVITDNIKNVEFTRGEELEIGDTSEKANLLTVTIDEETIEDILKAVIEEAKKDKLILKLLPIFEISKAEYTDALEEAAKELERGFSGSSDGKVEMQLYVNKEDEIIGRTIEVFSGKASQGELSYGIATKGKDSEYEFYIEDANHTRYVEISGNHTKTKDAYTGEAEVTVYGADFGMNSMTFNIDYEDLRTETKDDQHYHYGKLSLSSILLMGMELGLEYDVVDGVQHSKLSVGMGSTSIIGLDIAAERLKSFTIPKTDSSAQIFDSIDSSDYEATIDVEKFIRDLSDRLGIDLNTLMENLMFSGFLY